MIGGNSVSYDIEHRHFESRVQKHLGRLGRSTFFKRTYDLDDGFAHIFDGGRVQIGKVEAAEFENLDLVAHTLIVRHVFVTPSNRGNGLGTRAMEVIRDTFIDTNVALFLYAIPVEFPAYDVHGCHVVDEPEKQKRLVAFYEELGWVIQNPVKLYVPIMFLNMVTRYQKYQIIPAPMVLIGKKLPKALKDLARQNTISKEKWFSDCGLA